MTSRSIKPGQFFAKSELVEPQRTKRNFRSADRQMGVVKRGYAATLVAHVEEDASDGDCEERAFDRDEAQPKNKGPHDEHTVIFVRIVHDQASLRLQGQIPYGLLQPYR